MYVSQHCLKVPVIRDAQKCKAKQKQRHSNENIDHRQEITCGIYTNLMWTITN